MDLVAWGQDPLKLEHRCGSCLKQTDILSVAVADKLISQLTDLTTTSCDGADRMDNVYETDLGASLGCSGNTAQKHKNTLGRSREKEGENWSGKNTTGKGERDNKTDTALRNTSSSIFEA